jgi:hypothetical protein
MTTPSDEAVEAAMSSLVYFGYNDETKAKIIARQSSCKEYVGAALSAAYAIDMQRVRREALEEAAQALEAAHEDCATLNLLHGAARIRALANTKQE